MRMKSWQETARIFDELARVRERGERAALATLTRVEGSSYRKPGAKVLICGDGRLVGNVSGGCLENDLKERAGHVLASGRAEMVHYDTGADENTVWGLGLGCNGKIDIHLAPAPFDMVDDVRKKLAGDEPFDLAAGDFVERLEPPANLLIVGAGDDAIPFVRLAAEAGFRVWLVDHRPAYLGRDVFAPAFRRVAMRPEDRDAGVPVTTRTLAVVMNHHLGLDRAWAARLAETPAPYIGLLGPKDRRAEIMKAVPAAHHARFYGPTGLDVGADGPEQIAVSIVAELLAVIARRAPGHLRDRAKPIHGG